MEKGNHNNGRERRRNLTCQAAWMRRLAFFPLSGLFTARAPRSIDHRPHTATRPPCWAGAVGGRIDRSMHRFTGRTPSRRPLAHRLRIIMPCMDTDRPTCPHTHTGRCVRSWRPSFSCSSLPSGAPSCLRPACPCRLPAVRRARCVLAVSDV